MLSSQFSDIKCQLPSSHGYSVWSIFSQRVTQLMNHEGVCRTSPATPGLLIRTIEKDERLSKKNLFSNTSWSIVSDQFQFSFFLSLVLFHIQKYFLSKLATGQRVFFQKKFTYNDNPIMVLLFVFSSLLFFLYFRFSTESCF